MTLRLRDSTAILQVHDNVNDRESPWVTLLTGTWRARPGLLAASDEHLIRRSGQVVQDRPSPVVGWAGIPELSTRVGCCSAAWLQSWLQSRRNGADPRPSANECRPYPSCHELRERPWALPTADACCWLLLLLSSLLSVQPSESPGLRARRIASTSSISVVASGHMSMRPSFATRRPRCTSMLWSSLTNMARSSATALGARGSLTAHRAAGSLLTAPRAAGSTEVPVTPQYLQRVNWASSGAMDS